MNEIDWIGAVAAGLLCAGIFIWGLVKSDETFDFFDLP